MPCSFTDVNLSLQEQYVFCYLAIQEGYEEWLARQKDQGAAGSCNDGSLHASVSNSSSSSNNHAGLHLQHHHHHHIKSPSPLSDDIESSPATPSLAQGNGSIEPWTTELTPAYPERSPPTPMSVSDDVIQVDGPPAAKASATATPGTEKQQQQQQQNGNTEHLVS